MINENQEIQLIKRLSSEIDLKLQDSSAELLIKYMDLLLDWNKKINLTSITERNEVIIKHFIDSLIIFNKFEVMEKESVIDIGTGAGFPGLPMKIIREDLDVVLVDSLQKRVNFLETVISELGLKGIKVIHGRAEELAKKDEYRGNFGLAVSRAVAKMPVLVEVTLPFVKVGGHFISYKGPEIDEEIKSAEYAIKEMGSEVTKIMEIYLPSIEDKRSLVVVKKISKTSQKYPRKAGIPQKRPLGL